MQTDDIVRIECKLDERMDSARQTWIEYGSARPAVEWLTLAAIEDLAYENNLIPSGEQFKDNVPFTVWVWEI